DVGVPNRHYLEWLQKTFADAVRAAASDILGKPMQVRFSIDAELFRAARLEQAESAELGAQSAERRARNAERETQSAKGDASAHKQLAALEDSGAPRAAVCAPRPAKRRWRRLGDFIAGRCNRVAHASAISVVEAPGHGPNPLALHGPVSTGK